jgi:hypothetical protein
MKNVTVSLDDEVAQWVRVWAAKQNTSISQLLGNLLRRRMQEEQGYQAAMQQFLARTPKALKPKGERYPSRESLYER